MKTKYEMIPFLKGDKEMKNVKIYLTVNNLVFSGDFPQKKFVMEEWEFQSDSIGRNDVEKLFTDAITNETWVSYDMVNTPNSLEVSFELINFVESLDEKFSEEFEVFLDHAKKKINFFVVEHQNLSTIEKKSLISLDTLAITHKIEGQNGSAEIETLLETLKEYKIDFQIEYEHSQLVENGASGGTYEIIIFIANTLASGITYDLIKKFPSLNLINIKKDRVDVLKEKSSYYLNTQPENIVLRNLEVDMETNVASLLISFNRSKYLIKFNDRNEMINFEEL